MSGATDTMLDFLAGLACDGELNVMKWADRMRVRLHAGANSLGNLSVEFFHYLALFAIGAITVWAGIATFIDMLKQDKISVDDILLLFIYLELLAMPGIYFKTKVYVTNIPRGSYQMLASPDNAGAWCA